MMKTFPAADIVDKYPVCKAKDKCPCDFLPRWFKALLMLVVWTMSHSALMKVHVLPQSFEFKRNWYFQYTDL